MIINTKSYWLVYNIVSGLVLKVRPPLNTEPLQAILNYVLICFFALQATNAGARGDYDSVRSNNNLSYGCTVGAIVGAVVGVGSLFGIVFGLSSSSSRTSSCYYSSRYYC